MNGKLCFQTVKLPYRGNQFISPSDSGQICLCIVYIYIYVQFISRSCKNLKLWCASLHVAKAPVLFSLFEKKVILCSRFPDEEYIDFWISHSHLYVEWQHKPQEKAALHSCLHWKKLLCRPFEASNLSQGKPSRTVKQRDSNKRLFWCEDKLESF